MRDGDGLIIEENNFLYSSMILFVSKVNLDQLQWQSNWAQLLEPCVLLRERAGADFAIGGGAGGRASLEVR